MGLVFRCSVIWLGFFVLAFVNGAIREIGIKSFIGEPWAHHLSALTGIALFTAYFYSVFAKAEIHSYKEAALVGAYWFVLTVLAETFIVGRLVAKASWPDILQTYNVMQGNLWPLVLVWTGLLPAFMLWLKGK